MIWLKSLPRRYRGEKVHYDSVPFCLDSHNQCVNECVKVPFHIQNKTSRSGKTGRSGVDDSTGCTVVNPVYKNSPQPVHGAYSSSSTFLRATKILSNTHSQHPAVAEKEWSLLKCSSSLCVLVSQLWMPSVLCVTRDLSTKGHRLCGSDRHNYSTVCALTLPNSALN